MKSVEAIRTGYVALLGYVPDNIEKRLQLAELTDEATAIEVIEQFREKLILKNPLDQKTQQLVHFALLIGGMHKEPAILHAKGALKAGATPKELMGICETAAVTGGMPAFSLAVECVTKALETN
tara:strand:- start:538 stop:909 length:372 start_codon:yes stop_codon:yes gene_type:complete